MDIQRLRVEGFRGFSTEESLRLAEPNGELGSGLTFIVGPNNAGKSTIVECFLALNHGEPSFTEGKRNDYAGDRVSIEAQTEDGDWTGIQTVDSGGSETVTTNDDVSPGSFDFFILESRRDFQPFFSGQRTSRAQYTSRQTLPEQRGGQNNYFSNRLFEIQEKRDEFNEVLAEVLDDVPDWYIEQSDAGQYYLKYHPESSSHTSDGLGDGIISLLFIIDALYDSEPGETIAIDEPELSLHPPIQRRLMQLFAKYAEDRQIVISTHSPYFVDWNSLFNGGQLVRIHQVAGEEDNPKKSVISQVSRDTIEAFEGISRDLHNPHVLGLNAREAFFLRDRVILVEGQEDVLFYDQILDDLDMEITGDFWGWGAGGVGNIPKIVRLLDELGFQRVTAILDGNQADKYDTLRSNHPDYHFEIIPTDDVRSKPARDPKDPIEGVTDSSGNLKPEYRDVMDEILSRVDTYLGAG